MMFRDNQGGSQRSGRGPTPGAHMAMAMPVERARDFRGTLRRLLLYLKPWRLQLAAIFITASISQIFNIVSPKILGEATTKLFEGIALKMAGVPGARVDFEAIGRIILLLIVLYVLSAIFGYLQQFIMASVAQKSVANMRRDVSEKLGRLPLKYFDSHPHGDILSRVTNDVDTISTTLQQSVAQIITSVMSVIGMLIMMLTISPLMTLIAVVTLPLSFLVTINIAKRSQVHFAGQQRALGTLNGHVEEMFTGHKIVKAFGYEERSIAGFDAINERLYNAGWKAQFISGLIFPLMSFVNNLGYVLVSVVGGILVTQRAIAIGDIQAFIQYCRQFSFPIIQTANIANIIQSTVAAAERVFEVLDEGEQVPDREPALAIRSPRGAVALEHVTFGYQDGVDLIEDMNIDVHPGQTIAIVGPTGAGKTTVVNLLMRFYELRGGRITIDGVDITALRRGDLHRMFGMVLQDTWLFNGTIRDNIAYGREGAAGAEIVQAAKAAHADHFIRTLPEGYETILNEEASNISQGQKQLLTIARAILADPAILILDEATSSVDSRTEVYVQKAMAALMAGRTSFVIAHRLSTIREADLILVMDNGSIVERGKHDDLLAAQGFYAELYNSQFLRPNGANGPISEGDREALKPGPAANLS